MNTPETGKEVREYAMQLALEVAQINRQITEIMLRQKELTRVVMDHTTRLFHVNKELSKMLNVLDHHL